MILAGFVDRTSNALFVVRGCLPLCFCCAACPEPTRGRSSQHRSRDCSHLSLQRRTLSSLPPCLPCLLRPQLVRRACAVGLQPHKTALNPNADGELAVQLAEAQLRAGQRDNAEQVCRGVAACLRRLHPFSL
jgi:hypothetical protein